MKKIFLLLFFTIFSSTSAQNATEIVRKVDEKMKGNSSVANMTIRIVRPTWQREMSLRTWTKGNNLSMIFITAPAKDKGVVYLKRSKEVWNWIPSIDRNIKLPPSMMSQSWMGTDFTNDDLVKEASVVEDYNHSFAGDTAIDGRSSYKIILLPKPAASVVWGRVTMYVDKKEFLMLHAEYFDEEGELVNTMHASEVKNLGGRILPSRIEMIPADKKGNKTILIYNSLEFDKPLEDNFFTTANMQKLR